MKAAYACYSLNNEVRFSSSSGGVYPMLAAEIINRSGAVYAARYNAHLDVVHTRITNVQDIGPTQGSKYVESFLDNTFSNVIKDMKAKKPVLFVGTPCQCAGLNSLIRYKGLDRNLVILIDFVCHGVPGRLAWNAYKEEISQKGNVLQSLNMRDKSSGWTHGNYSWKQVFESGLEVITPQRQVSYMQGMLSNLYLRPSCFKCKFKGIERCTDLTLGDCWGIWNYQPELDDNKGTSLVLIHTDRGMGLFDSIKCKVQYADTDIDRAIKGNSCIIESTPKTSKSKIFYDRVMHGEVFSRVVADLTHRSKGVLLARKLKSFISKLRS